MRVFASLAFAALLCFGQSSLPRFDATDVRRSTSATNPYTFMSGGVLRGERYDLRKATMLDLIRTAYNVEPEVVLGGPNWLEMDRFDIAAKAPQSTSTETIRLMLQTLLADRFKLAIHKDTRPMPAIVLTIGAGKPKLTNSDGAGTAECRFQSQQATCRNMTMDAFVQRLRQMAGDYLVDPVVNSTGLEGAWDFELKWDSRSQVLQSGTERTTIFKAIERQLGLTLALKMVPAPVLVIDRVNEKPTDNPPGIAQILPPSILEFEVADLKMSRPDEQGCCFQVKPGGGLEARAMPLKILISAAWDVDWDHADEKILGIPKWTESARFDINAKASTATNGPPLMGAGYIDDDVRLMLRSLLIDRFRMKTHYEERLVDAYTLVAVKPTLKKGDPAGRASCKEARAMQKDPRDLNPRLSQLITCQNISMSQFAAQLQAIEPDEFAFEVADATAINGVWNFTLSYTPSWQLVTPAGNSQQAGDASDPSGGVSFFQAINKQLGLKLEKRKRMLSVAVIDHMEEKPTDN